MTQVYVSYHQQALTQRNVRRWSQSWRSSAILVTMTTSSTCWARALEEVMTGLINNHIYKAVRVDLERLLHLLCALHCGRGFDRLSQHVNSHIISLTFDLWPLSLPSGPMLMITEYCSHGDLLNFLRAHAQDFMVSILSVDEVEGEAFYKNMGTQHVRLRRSEVFLFIF